jgi:hypothetical protein
VIGKAHVRYYGWPVWALVTIAVLVVAIGGEIVYYVQFPHADRTVIDTVWILIFTTKALFWISVVRARRIEVRIRREGITATARVLAVKKSSEALTNLPLWAVRVQIDGAGDSYETELEYRIKGTPQVGDTLAVRVDPRHRERVVPWNEDDH